MASFRDKDGIDHFLVLPGDDVKLTLPTRRARPPKIVSDELHHRRFLREQDERIRRQFRLRPDPQAPGAAGHDRSAPPARPWSTRSRSSSSPAPTATPSATASRTAFERPQFCGIHTWRDKQGALLAAVQMETAILNVLLFMIIAVAGFGILAIFFMIVVEKTRDIGILKSLGASGHGVMGIFLTYGLSLGLVGSGVGMIIGLLIVRYINAIANLLGGSPATRSSIRPSITSTRSPPSSTP